MNNEDILKQLKQVRKILNKCKGHGFPINKLLPAYSYCDRVENSLNDMSYEQKITVCKEIEKFYKNIKKNVKQK